MFKNNYPSARLDSATSPLSKDEQWKLFTRTAFEVSHESDEGKRFEIIFDAFHKLGFAGEIRCRVGQLIEDGRVVAIKHGYGDYGTLNLKEVKYDLGTSATGNVFENVFDREEGFFYRAASLNPKWDGKDERTKHIPISMLSMPLFSHGKPIGIVSFDSRDLRFFSHEASEPLEAYKILVTNSLDPIQVERTPDLTTFVSRFKKRQVLVLGKDTGEELILLNQAASELDRLGYSSLLVKQAPDIPEMSNEEKVRVFADTSRFVVLENTFPAGQIAELKMCATNRIITACLRQAGKGSSWMVTDYMKDFDFISEFEYEGTEISLKEAVAKCCEWAEAKIKERIAFYDAKYPWRTKLEPEGKP